jgi:MFS family permease
MTTTAGTMQAETPTSLRQVIGSSAVGTVIEWYDFYIFGSLGTIIAPVLFGTKGRIEDSLLGALAVFGAGFVVRPLGAIVFGRIGDLIGRKYAFLMTLLIMGGATFLTGLIPSYEQIGLWAAVIALVLRLAQGLALGGEYGGAAVYVAEHVPDNKRGYYTSFIQITATGGLFLSLMVILATRTIMGEDAFKAWGWRIPFLLSSVLVALSVYIRLRLKESPLFTKLKTEGKTSSNPLRDAFGNSANWRIILTVLFGAAAGQAVVWYTGQFYALSWLQTAAGLNLTQASTVVAIALVIGTPFFVVFGGLSDRVGRKPIMMLGCLIAALAFIPIFTAMKAAAGDTDFIVKAKAVDDVKAGIAAVGPGASATGATFAGFLGQLQPSGANFILPADVRKTVNAEIKTAKASTDADVAAFGGLMQEKFTSTLTARNPNILVLAALVTILVLFVTMVYGPIAAFLVESFPAKIRYSSVSLPYHIGNGWFGGLLPLIATAIVASTGNIYAGLYYPIAVALLTFVVGMVLIRENRNVSLHNEGEAAVAAND